MKRTRYFQLRLSEAEYQRLLSLATVYQTTPSAWLRAQIMRSKKLATKPVKAD